MTSDATDSDAEGIDSGERNGACRAERSQLRSRKRALREQATPVGGEQDMTRAVCPATGRVTTCHGDDGRHGAGHVQRRVTAPDGERPAGPGSAAASAAGAAAFARAGEWDKSRASPRWLGFT